MYRGKCHYCGTEVECYPAETKIKGRLIRQDNNLHSPQHRETIKPCPRCNNDTILMNLA